MGTAEIDMTAPVITNATPLTNFALIGRPDLLLALWPGLICTTPDVLDEYLAGVAGGALPSGIWDKLSVIQLSTEEEVLMQSFSTRLGRGEQSCIAAASRRGGLLVTDDLDARRAARSLGIPITGSLGVLAAGVKAGLVDMKIGNMLLSKMITAGFRSPVDRLDGLLKE